MPFRIMSIVQAKIQAADTRSQIRNSPRRQFRGFSLPFASIERRGMPRFCMTIVPFCLIPQEMISPLWFDYGGSICRWIGKGWHYLLGGAERETHSKSRFV